MHNERTGFKGQAAVEVLAYASFFLLVFAIVTAVFSQMQNQELSRAESAYAQEIAYGLADNVHTAFLAGPGFSENVTLPMRLLGKPYGLNISSASLQSPAATTAGVQETGFIYVSWQGQNEQSVFSAPAVTPNFLAVDSPGFIATNGNLISIDPSGSCQELKVSNVNDPTYGNVILIEKGMACT